MTIRNGRFKSARTIIIGRAGQFYRILNSADFFESAPQTNKITVGFPGGNDTADVLPTFSLDFLVQGDVTVSGAGVVEGMYESLPNAEFRSGRFKTRSTMVPTDGITILAAGAGNARAVYRVFNSGATPLQVFSQNHGGGGVANIGGPIEADESLDFVTPQNKLVLVKGTVADKHIEGIYDFLARI